MNRNKIDLAVHILKGYFMDKLELSELLKQIRKFEKTHKVEDGPKIAVIGSCAIQYFVKILRYYLGKEGMNCKIYEGEYNGINMDVFDPDSAIYRFHPDYIIILPFYTDINNLPPLLADDESIKQCADSTICYYTNIWNQLSAIENVHILQGNFVIPSIRVLGNLEYSESYSTGSFLKKINEILIKEKSANVMIVDLDALSDNIGKYNWFDYPSYFLNKAAVRLEYMPEYVMSFVRQIKALRGSMRKCLVLDLDNTLWGGVVGDEGWQGIEIDPNNAVGEAYRFFQSYCLALRKRGIILAVCSKNDEAIAKEPFEKNENMILRLNDISCFIANWENKADNLRKIAQELNIGIDSLVFFDDNPAEREIVKHFLSEVHVIDVPADPALYVLQMEKEQPFEWLQITREDLERTDSYRGNKQRLQLQESFVDYSEYLQALDMRGKVAKVQQDEVARFTQLINKSNQFNLRTIRYSEADIQSMLDDRNTCCLYGKLSDRYSNYGIITCVILHKENDICFIDTWVMSCRVLKRGVENMMFELILKAAADMGCNSIRGEYIKTKKNKMVENFYDSLGFELKKTIEDESGFQKEYILNRLNLKVNHFIKEDYQND